MLRMEFAERIGTYATSIGAGIHTAEEARALEGLPNVKNSDLVPISPNVEGL
jgi:hypothetical protein